MGGHSIEEELKRPFGFLFTRLTLVPLGVLAHEDHDSEMDSIAPFASDPGPRSPPPHAQIDEASRAAAQMVAVMKRARKVLSGMTTDPQQFKRSLATWRSRSVANFCCIVSQGLFSRGIIKSLLALCTHQTCCRPCPVVSHLMRLPSRIFWKRSSRRIVPLFKRLGHSRSN